MKVKIGLFALSTLESRGEESKRDDGNANIFIIHLAKVPFEVFNGQQNKNTWFIMVHKTNERRPNNCRIHNGQIDNVMGAL